MDKICIILCYYGVFSNTFQSYLDTCGNNPSIDWIIVTDHDIKREYICPENVSQINITLRELEQLICEKLNYAVEIRTPYKLCDYKVAYGLIFEDYIGDYDWWGYGDCDVLYGNLRAFLTQERLDRFDKIYTYGHLCLLRNNEACKRAFQIEAANTLDWKYVYDQDETKGFDEHDGINLKMIQAGFRVDNSIDFVDRSTLSKRFRMVDYKDVAVYFTEPWIKVKYPKNYIYQFFGVEGERAYHFYLNKGKLMKREVSYIHYRVKYPDAQPGKSIFLDSKEWRTGIASNQMSVDEIREFNKAEKYEGLISYLRYYRAKMDRNAKFTPVLQLAKGIKHKILRK